MENEAETYQDGKTPSLSYTQENGASEMGEREQFCMKFSQNGLSLFAGCKRGFYLYGLEKVHTKLFVSNYYLVICTSPMAFGLGTNRYSI